MKLSPLMLRGALEGGNSIDTVPFFPPFLWKRHVDTNTQLLQWTFDWRPLGKQGVSFLGELVSVSSSGLLLWSGLGQEGEVENENSMANFSPSEWTHTPTALTTAILPSASYCTNVMSSCLLRNMHPWHHSERKNNQIKMALKLKLSHWVSVIINQKINYCYTHWWKNFSGSKSTNTTIT